MFVLDDETKVRRVRSPGLAKVLSDMSLSQCRLRSVFSDHRAAIKGKGDERVRQIGIGVLLAEAHVVPDAVVRGRVNVNVLITSPGDSPAFVLVWRLYSLTTCGDGSTGTFSIGRCSQFVQGNCSAQGCVVALPADLTYQVPAL